MTGSNHYVIQDSMKTVCLSSGKGGVGKTSLAVNLALLLADESHKVLMIDVDSQCNATKLLRVNPDESLFQVLNPDKIRSVDVTDYIQQTGLPALFALPGSLKADKLTKQLEGIQPNLLKTALKRASFDYVVIDTPPNLDHLTQQAIFASDGVIIPIDDSKYSVDGCLEIMGLVRSLGSKVLGVVINRCNSRTALFHQIKSLLEKNLQGIAFENTIRNSVAISEMTFSKKLEPITKREPRSQIALDYSNLKREVLERVNQ